MSSEPIFEPDADLDWWLNLMDAEIVFEPELDLPAAYPEDEEAA